jgi:hypothetical protein
MTVRPRSVITRFVRGCGGGQVQQDGAGVMGEVGGPGEDPQPQPLGLPAAGGMLGEGKHLGPGGDVAGQRDDGLPDPVFGPARAGAGWSAVLADDHPHALRPPRQRHQAGGLDNPRAGTRLAASVVGRLPRPVGQPGELVDDGLCEAEPDRVRQRSRSTQRHGGGRCTRSRQPDQHQRRSSRCGPALTSPHQIRQLKH